MINSISEIAENLLIGNIPIQSQEFKKLSKYKAILRRLRKKTTVKTRRNLLQQKGGFLPLLIPPALSLLATVLGSVVSKRIMNKE